MNALLDRLFQLRAKNTTVGTELIAGVTTFITMVYIIFVNPQMMAMTGMDHGAAFVGTCLAAALACYLMGFYANWPVGLAPGMGLNAFFTFTVVGDMGYSWQVALGAVFIAGVLFVIMSVTRLRRWMMDSIPLNMRIAMGAGVGLFVGFIGLKSGGIIVANDATYLTLGDLTKKETLLAALGFLVIAILSIRKVPRCHYYWYSRYHHRGGTNGASKNRWPSLRTPQYGTHLYATGYYGCLRCRHDQRDYCLLVCKSI